MRLLATGFMPFGGQRVNPSWEALALLRNRDFGAETRFVCLPVEWRATGEALRSAIAAYRPHCVLMIGQAGGSDCVRIERQAWNVCDCAAPDNAGIVLRGEPVVPNGQETLSADYPYDAILSALTRAGIPAEFSFDAGRFLCNFALYTALSLRSSGYPGMRAGFMHLPYLPGQNDNAPSMPLEVQTSALELALRACVSAGE